MMIEFEYWWLLVLPLFFTLGWIAARVDIRQLLSESTTLPAAYFKGLNFLIGDQHDKAVEAFSEAVQANSDSLELHFALGSLFRRTGETDRAGMRAAVFGRPCTGWGGCTRRSNRWKILCPCPIRARSADPSIAV